MCMSFTSTCRDADTTAELETHMGRFEHRQINIRRYYRTLQPSNTTPTHPRHASHATYHEIKSGSEPEGFSLFAPGAGAMRTRSVYAFEAVFFLQLSVGTVANLDSCPEIQPPTECSTESPSGGSRWLFRWFAQAPSGFSKELRRFVPSKLRITRESQRPCGVPSERDSKHASLVCCSCQTLSDEFSVLMCLSERWCCVITDANVSLGSQALVVRRVLVVLRMWPRRSRCMLGVG